MDTLKAIIFGLVVCPGRSAHVEPRWELELKGLGEFEGSEGEISFLCCFDQGKNTGREGSRLGVLGWGTRMSASSAPGRSWGCQLRPGGYG